MIQLGCVYQHFVEIEIYVCVAFAVLRHDSKIIVLVAKLKLQDVHSLYQTTTFLLLETALVLQALIEYLVESVLIRTIRQVVDKLQVQNVPILHRRTYTKGKAMLLLAIFQHIAEEYGEEIEHGGTVFRANVQFDVERQLIACLVQLRYILDGRFQCHLHVVIE